jgi:hypothetical protein
MLQDCETVIHRYNCKKVFKMKYIHVISITFYKFGLDLIRYNFSQCH